jgi:hypothetical protein
MMKALPKSMDAAIVTLRKRGSSIELAVLLYTPMEFMTNSTLAAHAVTSLL